MKNWLIILLFFGTFLGSIVAQEGNKPFVQKGDSLLARNESSTSARQESFTELVLPLSNKGFFKESLHKQKGPKVGLVLSGGGARGVSHIGVVQALEELGIGIDLITGTSSGAIIGSFLAAGYSPLEIEEIFKAQNWDYLFSSIADRKETFATQKIDKEGYAVRFRFDDNKIVLPKGFTEGQNIQKLLYDYLSPANFNSKGDFDKLKIPFRAVAVDLASGKPVIFDKGDLPFAVKCASAIPLFFTPVLKDEMFLVDGGLIYPIPTEIADSLGCDVIICVDVTAPKEKPKEEINAPWVVLTQTTAIMAQDTKIREKALADVVIEPTLASRGILDFSDLDSLIQAGYDATMQQADKIIALTTVDAHLAWLFNEIIWEGESLELETGIPLSTGEILDEMDRLRCEYGYSDIHCKMYSSHIEITASPAPTVENINIHGLTIFNSDSLEQHFEKISFIDNNKCNSYKVQGQTDSLMNQYFQKGYLLARIDSIYMLDKSLNININEGTIERLNFKGNYSTQKWYIESLLNLRQGSLFNINTLQSGISALNSTGIFENIYYNIQRGQKGVILLINFVEKKQPVIGLRAYYDTHYEGLIGFSIQDENFLGTGSRLEMGNRYGKWLKEFYVTQTSDRLWRTHLTSRATFKADGKRIEYYRISEANGRYESYSTYSLQSIGMEFLLGQQISRMGTLYAGFGFKRVNLVTPENKTIENDESREIMIRSIVDTYDAAEFPKNGKNHFSEYMLVQDVLGGDHSYWRLIGSYESWYSIDKFSYHPHVSGGYSAGGLMPRYMLFTIGEMIPFYGLAGEELRGWSYINTGIDGRLQIKDGIFPVYIKGGISIGKVWQKDAQLELDKIITGEGLELSIGTPIGPLKAGFGFLNSNSDYFWSVSIGRK